MTFPSTISAVIDSIATGSLALLSSVVTSYWPYLIGLTVLMGLAYKFRGMFRVAR